MAAAKIDIDVQAAAADLLVRGVRACTGRGGVPMKAAMAQLHMYLWDIMIYARV